MRRFGLRIIAPVGVVFAVFSFVLAQTTFQVYLPHIVQPEMPTATVTDTAGTTATATPISGTETATTTATSTLESSPTSTLTSVPTATPTATTAAATPTSTRVPTFNNCQADPSADSAPNFPVDIVDINKQAEVVTLKNVSSEPINLNGWRMCSILANQEHTGIGGMLQPGEVRDFAHAGGGNIWNNSQRDDGALYNPAGQLISYFVDQ